MSGFTAGDKFILRIKDRLHNQNKNWLACVCGETGSGKSYSAIGLGLMIGKVHIVFSAIELLKLINNPLLLKKGDVIIFEEGGILLSSRNWNSTTNKVLGAVFQSFRNLNIAVIFTTPHLKFIDVQARVLFHNYFQTIPNGINLEKNCAFLKVYDIKPNSMSDKVYYVKPSFVTDGQSKTKLKYIGVPKPNQELLDYYEKRKKEFTNDVNKDALESVEFEKSEQNQTKAYFNPNDYVDKVMQDKERFIKFKNGKASVNVYELMNEFNLGESKAHRLKVTLERMESAIHLV
jgi:hypothetical protein